MDEITLFTALRPEPPDNAEQMLHGARARLAGGLGEPAQPRPLRARLRRRRAVLLAACVAAAAACAAIVVPSVVPGRSAGPLVTEAWAVQRNPDGTIKVTFEQARDAAGLQRTLRADGIRAYVRFTTWVVNPGGPVTAWPAEQCNQAPGGRPVPGRIVSQVFPFPAGGAPNRGYAVTIRPSAIPAGDAILIMVVWGPDGGGVGWDVTDQVMSNDKPPVCTPQRSG
ncbi:MAG: hypothetical protein JO132_15480 [Streptosporangiaceae bacterium]|nr:hypothetical protein [Streptosporangiaceae bacterium]